MTENSLNSTQIMPSIQESPQIQRAAQSAMPQATNTAPKNSMFPKKFSPQMVFGILLLLLLLIAGGVGLYLSSRNQDLRQQASVGTKPIGYGQQEDPVKPVDTSIPIGCEPGNRAPAQGCTGYAVQ